MGDWQRKTFRLSLTCDLLIDLTKKKTTSQAS